MGDSPSVPKPSKEEKALQAEQTEILRQQREIIGEQYKQQQLLSPILFEELGISAEYDPEGNITGYRKETSEIETLRDQVEQGLLERSKAALAGELPISPTLERELTDQEQKLNDRLLAQLGPGYATSTPGIDALGKFGQSAVELRESARRGELTLAEQLGVARGGFNLAAGQNTLSSALGVNRGALESANVGINLANSFGNQVGQYQQDRALELQASIASAQHNPFNTLAEVFGVGAGIAAGFV